MLDKLSYKHRFYILLAAGIIVFLLSYWLAISRTVATFKQLRLMERSLRNVESAPENIAVYENKLQIANKKIGENLENETVDFQKNLLDVISLYCAGNSLILREFPRVHKWQKKDYQFITCYANIEGTFIPLIKLLDNVEKSQRTGRIVSVNFSTYEDHLTRRLRLTMSIYVQIIKQNYETQTE
jgi:hypothetical protein